MMEIDLVKPKHRKRRKLEHCSSKDEAKMFEEPLALSDSEDSGDLSADPFLLHFQRNLDKDHEELIKNASWTSNFETWTSLGRVKFENLLLQLETKSKSLLLDDSTESPLPAIGVPILCPNENFSLNRCHIKPKLQKRFKEYLQQNSKNLKSFQKELLTLMASYRDVYYPENSYDEWEDTYTIYSLHAINHVLKARKQVIMHNNKINRKGADYDGSDLHRDQGYTRPKVLILLPFKHTAYRVIKIMMKLLFEKAEGNEVQNRKRFDEDFGPSEDEKEESLNRPDDFLHTFKGDINEDFKIGLSVTKKSLKLYADFYQSDIIVASPLGLRYTVSVSTNPDYDPDYLTSIEILILDQADVFLMQNWEHIPVLMESINRPPCNIQKVTTDLTRVRYWALDDLATHYRQTLIFSSTTVDRNRAVAFKCTNFAGKAQVLNFRRCGSIEDIAVRSEVILRNAKGVLNEEARFNFFIRQVWPQLRSDLKNHTLIYVPDYIDYNRLVHYLKKDGGASIATINEYMVSENSKVAKARSLFFEGKKNFLIYTERFHFYRRYRIKGVQHVVFYALPTYPHFFSELCNMMVERNQNPREPELCGPHTITAIYQSSDATKLIGVLGSNRAAAILNSDKALHMCAIER